MTFDSEGVEVTPQMDRWMRLAMVMGVRLHRIQLDALLWKHLAANVMSVKYVARPLWK